VSLVVDEHRQYLADIARLESFEHAISQVVKPGDVVLDLGCGTGILGMLACRSGAKRVYSVDQSSMIGLARDINAANQLRDNVVFLKEMSTRVTLPEKADVVVADQIGRFGFDAGVLEYFADARDRLLKPDGRMIPNTIDFHVAPVESGEMRDRVEFWLQRHAGFDFSPAFDIAANTGYGVKLRPEELLGDPATAGSVDILRHSGSRLDLEARVNVSRPGRLDGIGGWFSAELSENVTMTNSPLSERRIDRSNIYLPVQRSVAVRPGDQVLVHLTLLTRDVMISWEVKVYSQGASVPRHAFAQSTFKGMLLSGEDLVRTRPDFVPRLNPWGEARRTVVNLCDGRSTIADIEAEVRRGNADLFPTQEAVAQFVAEVVTRYSQ
jgi:protein arginine N-methyltransferase 1